MPRNLFCTTSIQRPSEFSCAPGHRHPSHCFDPASRPRPHERGTFSATVFRCKLERSGGTRRGRKFRAHYPTGGNWAMNVPVPKAHLPVKTGHFNVPIPRPLGLPLVLVVPTDCSQVVINRGELAMHIFHILQRIQDLIDSRCSLVRRFVSRRRGGDGNPHLECAAEYLDLSVLYCC